MRYELVPYTKGRVLELASDGRRTFPHFITVDEGRGDNWKPDIITSLKDLSIFASQSMDAIYAKNVIENIDEREKVLCEWWRVIKHGGYIVFECDEKKMSTKELIELMGGGSPWDLVVSEPGFWQVYQKGGKKHTYSYTETIPDKTCAIFRHGGFGDMIQMSPLLPSLKDMGYHITLYTSHYGEQVVRHDPHLDKIIIMDKDQVPNHELVYYWQYLSDKYDKFINLSESVEASLLVRDDRVSHWWSKQAIEAYTFHNYHDFTHLIAGVPKKYEPKFYSTKQERKWAASKRKKISGKLVMWALAGSSVHKIYPWLDQVIAHFMLNTQDVNFVLVGSEDCKIIESPWRDEKRVACLSGECSVRESMALAMLCDVVIGPETGILNAVSHEDVPKIVNLSHSSVENLTKYWKNCISLEPEDCPCHPCHKTIYGFDNCVRDDKTGVSLCQANIHPPAVIGAIGKQLNDNL